MKSLCTPTGEQPGVWGSNVSFEAQDASVRPASITRAAPSAAPENRGASGSGEK